MGDSKKQEFDKQLGIYASVIVEKDFIIFEIERLTENLGKAVNRPPILIAVDNACNYNPVEKIISEIIKTIERLIEIKIELGEDNSDAIEMLELLKEEQKNIMPMK